MPSTEFPDRRKRVRRETDDAPMQAFLITYEDNSGILHYAIFYALDELEADVLFQRAAHRYSLSCAASNPITAIQPLTPQRLHDLHEASFGNGILLGAL